jgi:hypothetical protein
MMASGVLLWARNTGTSQTDDGFPTSLPPSLLPRRFHHIPENP